MTRMKSVKHPALSFTPAPSGVLQRKCACAGKSNVEDECSQCKAKQLELRRYRSTASAEISIVPPIANEVLSSPGQPLDRVTREFMESRFGHDFSQVRVHTDPKASESARAVNSLAYTVGHNVVFGAGRYSPHTVGGRKLLAHELTHVVQQSNKTKDPHAALRIGSHDDAYEREAASTASSIVDGSSWVTPVRNTFSGAVSLQRHEAEVTTGRSPVPKPIQRPCDTWELNPPDFAVEIAKQYLLQEFNSLPPEVASVDCGDGGDDCMVYFRVPTDSTVHVVLDHKPVSVSAVRIGPPAGRRPFCDYSYECKRSGELILTKLRCTEPGSP